MIIDILSDLHVDFYFKKGVTHDAVKTLYTHIFTDIGERTSEENKGAPFVHVESLSKSYTVEEFLGLSDEEKKELSVALSSREFAGLYDKTKYMYNKEMDEQILDIIVLSSKQ